MKQRLYVDPFSGISGDMFAGALLDLGVPWAVMDQAVAALHIKDLVISREQVLRRDITATKFRVFWARENVPVSHRHLPDIEKILRESDLSQEVQDRSFACFEHLAHAEAEIHGKTPLEVHFHEVGGEDSIADIVAVTAGLHALSVDLVVVGPINLGRGFVVSAHGRYPVPAPATLKLLEGYYVFQEGPKVELTTPTGAALIKTWGVARETFPPFMVHAVGYGAGDRDLAAPNVLRLILGTVTESEAEAASSRGAVFREHRAGFRPDQR